VTLSDVNVDSKLLLLLLLLLYYM